MSATYSITSRVQTTKWDPEKQEAVEGWEITARWASTGTLLRVFVPLAVYNPTEVDSRIVQAGQLDERIGALGGGSS